MRAPLPSALARLAVAVVRFVPRELDAFAAKAGPRALAPAEKEALLQCHLFCGFPRTIAALDHLRSAGIRADPEGASGPTGSARAGEELFDRIYGDGADGVRQHLRSLDPDLADLVAGHAYGTVLSREGLDARDRELLAVVMLAATGHDRQLASHARGAIRCGADPDEVSAALDAVEDLVPGTRMERARDVVARFTRGD